MEEAAKALFWYFEALFLFVGAIAFTMTFAALCLLRDSVDVFVTKPGIL